MTTIDGVIKRAALPRVAGLGRRGMRVAVAVGATGAAFSHIALAVGSCATAISLVIHPEARHAVSEPGYRGDYLALIQSNHFSNVRQGWQ